MENIHKEILGLMGKIDINCREEQGAILVVLAGQLDAYNSGDLAKIVEDLPPTLDKILPSSCIKIFS